MVAIEVEVRHDRAVSCCPVTGIETPALPDKREVFIKGEKGFVLAGWFMANVDRAPLNLNYPFAELVKVQIEEAVRSEYANVAKSTVPLNDMQKRDEPEEDDE